MAQFIYNSDFASQLWTFKNLQEWLDLCKKLITLRDYLRLEVENVKHGSGPSTSENMKINYDNDGRGVYFRDTNGHLLEILTTDYKIEL